MYNHIFIPHYFSKKIKKKIVGPRGRPKFSQEGREGRKAVAAKATDVAYRRRTFGHHARIRRGLQILHPRRARGVVLDEFARRRIDSQVSPFLASLL